MPTEFSLLGLFEGAIFSNVEFSITLVIIIGFIIGGFSGNAMISMYGGFLFFLPIAIETDISIFTELLYLILILIALTIGLRIWSVATGQTSLHPDPSDAGNHPDLEVSE